MDKITTVVKIIFSHSGGLKTSRFDENLNSHFSHKTNDFSHYENVKILTVIERALSIKILANDSHLWYL